MTLQGFMEFSVRKAIGAKVMEAYLQNMKFIEPPFIYWAGK